MSDVRLNKPALPAAFGLALALTFSGTIDPANAGSALRTGPNEKASARNFQPTVVVADNDADLRASNPNAASDPAPDAAGDPPRDAPAPDVPPETAEAKPQMSPAPAEPVVAPKSPVNDKPLPVTGPDYYTQRAKQAVKEDENAEGKPHPLQLQYPDQNVVVCEGGCPSEKSAQIVFMEPRSARKPIAEGEMIPSSSDAASAPMNSVITCEAGCYDSAPRSYSGIPGGVAVNAGAPAAVSSNDGGSWVTTVTPAAAQTDSAGLIKAANAKLHTQSGSGEWMNRISKETGQGDKSRSQKTVAPVVKVEPAMQVAAAEPVTNVPAMASAAPTPKPEASPVTEAKAQDEKSEQSHAGKPVAATASEPASSVAQSQKAAPDAPVMAREGSEVVAAAASAGSDPTATKAAEAATAPAVVPTPAPVVATVANPEKDPDGHASLVAEVSKGPETGPAVPVSASNIPAAPVVEAAGAVKPAAPTGSALISSAEAAVPLSKVAAADLDSAAPAQSRSESVIDGHAETPAAIKPSIINEGAAPVANAIVDANAKADTAPVTGTSAAEAASSVIADKDAKPLVVAAAAEPVPTPAPASQSSPPPATEPVKVQSAEATSGSSTASDSSRAIEAAKEGTTQVAALSKPESQGAQAAPAPVSGSHRDPVVNIETADLEMASAQATARANLPEFWAKLEAPAVNESDFSLKVAIQGRTAKEVEHFWLTNITRKNGKITGVISNDPSTVKSVHRGQTYEINPDKISDWLYKRDGKMVGNETMRPLLKRLPAQQAASYREMYEKP